MLKCPLQPRDHTLASDKDKCIREECAWWCSQKKSCAVCSIADLIQTKVGCDAGRINNSVSDIESGETLFNLNSGKCYTVKSGQLCEF